MLIEYILITLIPYFISAMTFFFPPVSIISFLPTSVVSVFDVIASYVLPIGYAFALDQFILAFTPIFIFAIWLSFEYLVKNIKLLVKWW